MNKVLVTGLAIGRDFGCSKLANYNFSWLLQYPSVMLWAEKILVPSAIWDVITSDASFPESKPFSQAIRVIFEMANADGLIEIVSPQDIFTPAVSDAINVEIQDDLMMISKKFPAKLAIGADNSIPGHLSIDGQDYCHTHVKSLYAALFLGRACDANCLLDDHDLNLARYKFDISYRNESDFDATINAFQTVFEMAIPNNPLIDGISFMEKSDCAKCQKLSQCSTKYLADTERNTKNILVHRSYDEIQQLRQVINKIIDKRNDAGDRFAPRDIISDLEAEQAKLQKRIKSVFPKVERWNNMITSLSIPVALFGSAVNEKHVTMGAAGIGALAQASDKVINLLKSKYSWINYNNSPKT